MRRRSTTPSHADSVCATLTRGEGGSRRLDSTPCPWKTVSSSELGFLLFPPGHGPSSGPSVPAFAVSKRRVMVAVLTGLPGASCAPWCSHAGVHKSSVSEPEGMMFVLDVPS